jgi:hypothetical protein
MSEQTINTTTGTARATSHKTAQQKAKDATSGCWIGGLALLVIGGIIAGASLPSFDTLYGASGSQGGFLFGLTMMGVGQIILFVGIIATGVRLGVTSTARSQG